MICSTATRQIKNIAASSYCGAKHYIAPPYGEMIIVCPASRHGPQHSCEVLCRYNKARQRYGLTSFRSQCLPDYKVSNMTNISNMTSILTHAFSKESHEKRMIALDQVVEEL